jgi:hypothetical protein
VLDAVVLETAMAEVEFIFGFCFVGEVFAGMTVVVFVGVLTFCVRTFTVTVLPLIAV